MLPQQAIPAGAPAHCFLNTINWKPTKVSKKKASGTWKSARNLGAPIYQEIFRKFKIRLIFWYVSFFYPPCEVTKTQREQQYSTVKPPGNYRSSIASAGIWKNPRCSRHYPRTIQELEEAGKPEMFPILSENDSRTGPRKLVHCILIYLRFMLHIFVSFTKKAELFNVIDWLIDWLILRFLTFSDPKRITILKYTRYVHKLNLTITK